MLWCKGLPNNICKGKLETEMVPDHGLLDPRDGCSDRCLDLSGEHVAFMGTKRDPTAYQFFDTPERAPATLAWKESSSALSSSEEDEEEEEDSSSL